MTELLEYQQVSKTFGKQKVLDNINLKISAGKIVGLLGQNGAGKSTLIKLANDLITPDQGKILFAGQPISLSSKAAISYLPERTYLNKNLTIAATFKLFNEFYNNFDMQKAEQIIYELGLRSEKRIAKMSKGMQEKLQLALVMSRNAKLYILDEPLGGIDPATRDFILDTILSNFAQGSSVLISTHLIADIERILDEVIFIDHGKIILTANADQLRNKHHASIDKIFRQTFKANLKH